MLSPFVWGTLLQAPHSLGLLFFFLDFSSLVSLSASKCFVRFRSRGFFCSAPSEVANSHLGLCTNSADSTSAPGSERDPFRGSSRHAFSTTPNVRCSTEQRNDAALPRSQQRHIWSCLLLTQITGPSSSSPPTLTGGAAPQLRTRASPNPVRDYSKD